MMGEARQLDVHRRAIGTAGQRDPEDLCCGDGILAEGLIEVPDTEEQDSIWMLGLDLHVLLHQGGLYDLLCHCLGGNGWGLFLYRVGIGSVSGA